MVLNKSLITGGSESFLTFETRGPSCSSRRCRQSDRQRVGNIIPQWGRFGIGMEKGRCYFSRTVFSY